MEDNTGKKIRVLLVDDHAMVLEGIRGFLATQAQIEIAGTASDGEEAVEKAKQLHPDVVLMDINMPRMNGFEATRILKSEVKEARVIGLSMHEDRAYASRLVESGARGYLEKRASGPELITAIEKVHGGDVYFPPALSQALLRHFIDDSARERVMGRGLTPREVEILILIADGNSNKEIADKLFSSIRTIQKHRENIMLKLGIDNVAGLTKFAIARGWVSVETSNDPEEE